MSPLALSLEALCDALLQLRGWSKVEGRSAISKEFRFDDFPSAFAFMTRAALMAEKLEHHPEWCNVYNSVNVTLLTHDADGVTELDLRLAAYMDEIEH